MTDLSPPATCPSCGTSALPEGARFCPACGSLLAGAPKGALSQEDELHQVTVMFPDVVGSTALGDRLPPEEVKALIGEAVSAMAQAVEDYGGFVQAYQGDGICAVFGVPAAHEDDPERAARAALRIRDRIRAYARDVEAAWGISGFDVRVGINTGPAVVGAIGASDPQMSALGDATNTAARLQGVAEPGTVVVGEATARRLSDRFVLEEVGPFELKGKPKPVRAFRLVRESAQAVPAPGTPLVGRDREVALVEEVLAGLRAGRGRIVQVVGEAGIGKSRLMAELTSRSGDLTTLQGRCLSYGGALTYWPFVEALRGWLEVTEGEAEMAVRLRLRARLGDLLGEAADEVLPYLGRLLGVRLDPGTEERVGNLPAEALAEQIHRAYRAFVEGLAARSPLILIIEDLHWADPSTRALAEALLESMERSPLLIAVTYRTEPDSEAWRFRLKVQADHPHRAVDVPLHPLAEGDSAALAETIVPGHLDEGSRDAIVARAEGNPLYLEQLVRTLAEAGSLRATRVITVERSDLQVLPPALEGLLVSRIDRLPPGPRRLAQIAAVAGRSFLRRVLERVAPDADLDADLGALLRADLIREHRWFPELEYIFTHGLIQEAAMSTLTLARRRELHGRVARALEELFAGGIQDYLDILAHHYSESEDRAKALEYLRRAGDRAAGIYANRQAVTLWEKARKLAQALGEDETYRDIAEREAHLLIQMGEFDRGIELYRELASRSDRYEGARLLAAAASGLIGGGEVQRADVLVDEAMALDPADPAVRAQVLLARAGAAKSHGRYEDMRVTLEAIEGLEAEMSPADREKLARGWMGYFMETGQTQLATEWAVRALSLAEGIGNPIRILWARSALAAVKTNAGDVLGAAQDFRDLYSDARAMGDLSTVLEAGVNLIEVEVRLGRLVEAEALAAELLPTVTSPIWKAVVSVNLGELELERGRPERARRSLQEAVALSESLGMPQFGMWARLLLPMVDLSEGVGDPEGDLRRVIEEARKIEGEGHSWMLAHRFLAEVLLKRGRPAEARGVVDVVLSTAEREGPATAVVLTRLLGQAQEDVQPGAGRTTLERALSQARTSGFRLEEARSLLALARSAGTTDAPDTLRQARELLERCGAARDLAEL